MRYRVVTTAPDGTRIVDHHDFENARMDAEQMKSDHAVVSVYRDTGGEPDLLWSSRIDDADS